jgi:tetratricopeptide (TPR) repeat protein
MKRFVLPLAVSLCVLIAVSGHSAVSAKDTWMSVRTKNFYLIGNASEKDIRRVALKLEQFREAFTRLVPLMRYNTPVPTTVVVFKTKSAYAPFGPPGSSGYFQAGPDVNYIAIPMETRRFVGVFNIIFHEYTHLLVNNTFKNVPLWFNEGVAEYYSTFDITDDQKFQLGYPIGNHILFLRENKLLPLRTLFEVTYHSPQYNEKSKKSIFYAQSWALMHYLIIGKEGQLKKVGKFMELIGAGMPVETAFPQAFETTFDAMEKELSDYINQKRYPVIRDTLAEKIQLDTTAEAKPLTEAEVEAYLGDLLLHSNHPDAEQYLENALKLDPNLAMAHASLGMLRFREGRTDEARASLERAVAANSQNYLTHYYYVYTLSRRRPEEKASKYSPEQIAKIREHLKRAIELRPDYPESHNLMAYVNLVTGEHVDESIASLKRILSASPGRIDSTFMLGQLYMLKNDYKTARPLLEQVTNSQKDEAKVAEQLLDRITKYEKELAEWEEVQKSRSNVITADPLLVRPPSDPSEPLREALRKPRDGETQIMATLVKIECEVKNITFILQIPSGLLRLRTRSFAEVAIVTYAPDVAGDISCGPRKPVNTVVICYVPSADKRLKSDGVLKSVEFVPADFKLKPDRS